jgi:hypothetical protein
VSAKIPMMLAIGFSESPSESNPSVQESIVNNKTDKTKSEKNRFELLDKTPTFSLKTIPP